MNGIKVNLVFLIALALSSIANLLYIRGMIGGMYYHMGYVSVIVSGIAADGFLHRIRKSHEAVALWHHISWEECQYLTILLLMIWIVTYGLVIYFR